LGFKNIKKSQHNILRRNTINDNVKDRHYAFFYIIFCPFSPPLLCKNSPFAIQLHCFYTLIDALLIVKSNAFTSEGLHHRKTKGLRGSIFNDEASNHSSFYLYICTIVLSIKRTTQEERTHHSSDKILVFQQCKCPINTNQTYR